MVNIFQNVPPLDWQTPIVNQDGTPSAQFIRIWRYVIENTNYTIDGLDGKVNKTGDTMTGALIVDTGTGALPAGTIGTIVASGPDATAPLFEFQAFGGAGGFIANRAQGTRETPANVGNSNAIFSIIARGWVDGAWTGNRGAIRIMASQAWNATGQGTRIVFYGVTNNTTTEEEWARLANGNFQMGGANTVITADRHPQLRSYITSDLPSATGRAGQLVYVSDASAGQQVQFSDGSSWVAPGGGGGGGSSWTSVAAWDFSIDGAVANVPANVTGYSEVLVEITDVSASVTGRRCLEVSTDGGSSYYAGGSDYQYYSVAGVGTNQDKIYGHATNSTAIRTCIMHLFNVSVNGIFKSAYTYTQQVHQMFRANTNPITNIRVLNSGGGNLNGGTVRIYAR